VVNPYDFAPTSYFLSFVPTSPILPPVSLSKVADIKNIFITNPSQFQIRFFLPQLSKHAF